MCRCSVPRGGARGSGHRWQSRREGNHLSPPNSRAGRLTASADGGSCHGPGGPASDQPASIGSGDMSSGALVLWSSAARAAEAYGQALCWGCMQRSVGLVVRPGFTGVIAGSIIALQCVGSARTPGGRGVGGVSAEAKNCAYFVLGAAPAPSRGRCAPTQGCGSKTAQIHMMLTNIMELTR